MIILSTVHPRQSNYFINYLETTYSLSLLSPQTVRLYLLHDVSVDDIWYSGRDCWSNDILVTRHFNKSDATERGTSGGMGRGLYHPTIVKSLGSPLMLHAGWEWKQTNLKIIISLELRKFNYKRNTSKVQTTTLLVGSCVE